MRFIKYVFDRIFAALAWFAICLLGIITLLIFADVFCRYCLNFSIAWADEVSLVLLVWYVFIALAIGVRKRTHVSIDLLSLIIPSRMVDKVAQKIVSTLTFCFGGCLIYFGIVLIKIGSYSTLASFDCPSYVEYLFIPLSGALVMYSALINASVDRNAEIEGDYLDHVFMNRADRNV